MNCTSISLRGFTYLFVFVFLVIVLKGDVGKEKGSLLEILMLSYVLLTSAEEDLH